MAKRRIARKRRTRRVKAKRGPNMFTKKVRAVIARQAETKSVRSTVLEQEITPAFNCLFVDTSLVSKIPFRPVLSTHVLVMKCILSVKHSTGFSKHLLLWLWHCELFCLSLKHPELLLGYFG